MSVRSAAKAIIIENDALLCIQYQDERGIHYGLPGGGQEPQEDLREAMNRECLEEIDCEVDVGALLFVREFIGSRQAELERHRSFHQIDHYFECQLKPNSVPQNGVGQDYSQQGVVWLPLNELEQVRFYPQALAKEIKQLPKGPRPVYLGAVN